MVNSIAIGIGFALIGIGVIGILISGIRNIISGKAEFKRVAVMLVPVIVFAITYATMGTFNQAGVATMCFMIAVMMVSILISGTRGTFKF